MVSLRSLFAGAVLLAAPVMASLDAWEVAKGLRALNIETHRIEYAAVHIAPANAWAPPDRSPIHYVVTAYEDIIKTAHSFTSQPDVNNSSARQRYEYAHYTELMFEAYVNLFTVNQELLSILINKGERVRKDLKWNKGAMRSVGYHLTDVLRRVRKTYKTIAIDMGKLFPKVASEAGLIHQSLDNFLIVAIRTYSDSYKYKEPKTFSA